MADTTSLYGAQRVKKTHPRILFRGQLDLLQSEVTLLCTKQIASSVYRELCDIQKILCAIMRAEVLEEPLGEYAICNRSLELLHALSHDLPGGHQFPTPEIGQVCAQLNVLRAKVRHLEILSIEALPERTDIHDTLNMLSGAVYTIMLEEQNR